MKDPKSVNSGVAQHGQELNRFKRWHYGSLNISMQQYNSTLCTFWKHHDYKGFLYMVIQLLHLNSSSRGRGRRVYHSNTWSPLSVDPRTNLWPITLCSQTIVIALRASQWTWECQPPSRTSYLTCFPPSTDGGSVLRLTCLLISHSRGKASARRNRKPYAGLPGLLPSWGRNPPAWQRGVSAFHCCFSRVPLNQISAVKNRQVCT